MKTEAKGRITQNPETHDTRALVDCLFAAYKQGDSQQLFDHVPDDFRWRSCPSDRGCTDFRNAVDSSL
jgi:ketosteroid isomerase-like protein